MDTPRVHGAGGTPSAAGPTLFEQVTEFVAYLRAHADLLSDAGLHRQRVAVLRLAWDLEHEGYKP